MIHILKLRELVRLRVVKKIWWTDTRDMITDGLTTGNIDRTAILEIAEKGERRVVHNVAVHPQP